MAGRFYHYRRGYLKVSMTGCAPERFFNICQGREIEVWEVCCKSGCYEFYMTVKGFKQAKTLARKAGVRLKILKKLGLPFFLYRNRKRKLSLAGFLLFFIFPRRKAFSWCDCVSVTRRCFFYDKNQKYSLTTHHDGGDDCDEYCALPAARFPANRNLSH